MDPRGADKRPGRRVRFRRPGHPLPLPRDLAESSSAVVAPGDGGGDFFDLVQGYVRSVLVYYGESVVVESVPTSIKTINERTNERTSERRVSTTICTELEWDLFGPRQGPASAQLAKEPCPMGGNGTNVHGPWGYLQRFPPRG